jgi:hypothetical protein
VVDKENGGVSHVSKPSEPVPCPAMQFLPMAASDLQRTGTDLGLEQYLPNCLQAGFHNFQSHSNLTEAELTALGVRLGHRRKLLRKIARDQTTDLSPRLTVV